MINVLQIVAGELGLNIADFIISKEKVQLVDIVDHNPGLINRDIGLLAMGESVSVKVAGALDESYWGIVSPPDVAIISTVSSIKGTFESIKALAESRLDMVTTCEELTYPWHQQPANARAIDEICKKMT